MNPLLSNPSCDSRECISKDETETIGMVSPSCATREGSFSGSLDNTSLSYDTPSINDIRQNEETGVNMNQNNNTTNNNAKVTAANFMNYGKLFLPPQTISLARKDRYVPTKQQRPSYCHAFFLHSHHSFMKMRSVCNSNGGAEGDEPTTGKNSRRQKLRNMDTCDEDESPDPNVSTRTPTPYRDIPETLASDNISAAGLSNNTDVDHMPITGLVTESIKPVQNVFTSFGDDSTTNQYLPSSTVDVPSTLLKRLDSTKYSILASTQQITSPRPCGHYRRISNFLSEQHNRKFKLWKDENLMSKESSISSTSSYSILLNQQHQILNALLKEQYQGTPLSSIREHHTASRRTSHQLGASCESVFHNMELPHGYSSLCSYLLSGVSAPTRQGAFLDGDDGFEMLNNYTILQQIGRGSTATVMLALDVKADKVHAVKMVRRTDSGKRQPNPTRLSFSNADIHEENESTVIIGSPTIPRPPIPTVTDSVDREIEIMRRVKHPNIVTMYEVIEDEEDGACFLVLDYINGSPLVSFKNPRLVVSTSDYKLSSSETSSSTSTPEQPSLGESKVDQLIDIMPQGDSYLETDSPINSDNFFLKSVEWPWVTSKNTFQDRFSYIDDMDHDSQEGEDDGDGYLKCYNLSSRMMCDPIRPLSRLRDISKQIVHALYYLHVFRNIVHRDIKPDNIILEASTDKPYLLDFGSAAHFTPSQPLLPPMPIPPGTPAFIAPEVCNGEECGPAADVWSLGVTLYCCVFGTVPFAGATVRDVIDSITNGSLAFPVTNEVSKDTEIEKPLQHVEVSHEVNDSKYSGNDTTDIKSLKDSYDDPSNAPYIMKQWKDLLYWMLRKNPNERPSIRRILNHDVFRECQ